MYWISMAPLDKKLHVKTQVHAYFVNEGHFTTDAWDDSLVMLAMVYPVSTTWKSSNNLHHARLHNYLGTTKAHIIISRSM